MGSLSIDTMRNEYPGRSDNDAAKAFAQKHGYIAIVRYKNSSSAPDFTDIGVCKMEDEIRGYLTSPYCHDAEILHDGWATAMRITEELILGRCCELCGKRATRESLQVMAGNDFYICPKCALMFCDRCYVRLPLTSSPGYGMCPHCCVKVQRTIPGWYGDQSGLPPTVEEQPQFLAKTREEERNASTGRHGAAGQRIPEALPGTRGWACVIREPLFLRIEVVKTVSYGGGSGWGCGVVCLLFVALLLLGVGLEYGWMAGAGLAAAAGVVCLGLWVLNLFVAGDAPIAQRWSDWKDNIQFRHTVEWRGSYPNRPERLEAARHLGQSTSLADFRTLVRALGDPFVSGAAANALSRPENLPQLRRALRCTWRRSTKVALKQLIETIEQHCRKEDSGNAVSI